jgi:thiosulfate/3-mercaptopyruvate sulfurtransferase
MTAVIVVTPRGIAGHFLIMRVTSSNMKSLIKREGIIRIGVVIAGILLIPIAAVSYQASSIPSSQLVNPNELVKILQSSAGVKPLIVQVGSHVLYTQAHIPDSEYIGPASSESGLQQLRKRVASLPRDKFIVIYCGCCPWNHCPNVKPANDALRAMGFTNFKVLYISDNFGTNWVDKGYPTAKGD